MAWFRCGQSGGGGGGIPSQYLYSFTKVKEWVENGIGSSSWLDDTGVSALGEGGTYSAVEGEYLDCNSNSWAYIPIANSYYLFGIKFQVDSNFSPRQTDNWNGASCIIGQEIAGAHRDCAVVISKNGYFAFGYADSGIIETSVNALDGNTHEIYLAVLPSSLVVFIDGNQELNIAVSMSGNQMSQMGVFNSQRFGDTRTYGKVYKVGYWSYTEPTDNIIEASLPTL